MQTVYTQTKLLLEIRLMRTLGYASQGTEMSTKTAHCQNQKEQTKREQTKRYRVWMVNSKTIGDTKGWGDWKLVLRNSNLALNFDTDPVTF